MFNPKQQQQFSTEKHFKVFLYENSSVQPLTETTLKEDKPKSVHRLILDQNGITTFEEFVQKLKTKSIINGTDFKLFYLDDQNDWVSLGDEEDWKILNSILSSETVIKIVCQNIVPKSSENQSSNPHCDFFKRFHAANNQRSAGHCPFGNSRQREQAGGCPWSRAGGCRRGNVAGMGGGFEQFAPLIENVVGSLFNNGGQGQQQQANPLFGNGSFDLFSLLNGFFPAATGGASSSQQQQQESSEGKQEATTESNNASSSDNHQIPPQFKGWNDLIKKFCGNLNDKVSSGDLNIPHFGIVCDGCGKKSFTGPRWNCTDCGDFDFCQECFETKANDHFEGFHSFTQVEPKAKSFLTNFMQKMDGNQQQSNTTTNSTQPQTASAQQPTPQSNATEEVIIPEEEKLDEELYPSLDTTANIPLIPTTSQLLSSQLIDENPSAPAVDDEQPTVVQEQQQQQSVESTPPPVLEYALEHQLLRDMGFIDGQANARLLKKHAGNVQRVITDLL